MTFGASVAGAPDAADGELAEPAPNVDRPPSAEPATEEAVETAGTDVTGVVGGEACPGFGGGTAGDGSPGILGSGTAGGGAGAGLGGVGTATGGVGTVTAGTVGMGTDCAAAAPASRHEPTRTVVAAAVLMPA